MKLYAIPLWCALLPAVAVHLCYLVAASQGHVEWCVPYVDSCTSISATGRKPPESYLFRALMIPSAVLMMIYWVLAFRWVQVVCDRVTSLARWMLLLGILACTGMIAYVTVLGEAGQAWATQRRAGTIMFYSFTYLAQLMLFSHLRDPSRLKVSIYPWIVRSGFYLNSTILATGLLTVVLDAMPVDYDAMEDAFEWVLTLMLQANFLLIYFAWKEQGYMAEFGIQGS